MPIQRTAWKEAAWIFLLSRFVIILVTYISFSILPLFGQTSGHICTLNINSCIFSWFHWDAIAYVNIAHHGYSLTRDTVFFPLWPLLIHGVGVLFGTSITVYYIAALLLSNTCFYFVLVVFYCLLSNDFEPTVAKNASRTIEIDHRGPLLLLPMIFRLHVFRFRCAVGKRHVLQFALASRIADRTIEWVIA